MSKNSTQIDPMLVSTSQHLPSSQDVADQETGIDAIAELSRQHERVSELLRCLDGGRWWSQSQPGLYADDVHKQVANIKAALDNIDVAVEGMKGR